MNRNRIALFLLLLLLAGCQLLTSQDDKDIAGSWTLYDVTALHPETVDFNTEALLKGALQTGSVLSFFTDDSFTKAEGNGDFVTGGWRLLKDQKALVLTTRKGEAEETLVKIEAPSMEHHSPALILARGEFLYKYIKTAIPLKDYEDDPFYKANNRWRITPQQPEDSIQVRERFANYLKHLALLLKASKVRQQTVVSFAFSQGPVKIYSGGIGAIPYGKVKRSWKNGYYDDAAAQYAYMLFGDYLSEDHYMGAGTGDWINDDYRILMTMYPAFHAGLKGLSL